MIVKSINEIHINKKMILGEDSKFYYLIKQNNSPSLPREKYTNFEYGFITHKYNDKEYSSEFVEISKNIVSYETIEAIYYTIITLKNETLHDSLAYLNNFFTLNNKSINLYRGDFGEVLFYMNNPLYIKSRQKALYDFVYNGETVEVKTFSNNRKRIKISAEQIQTGIKVNIVAVLLSESGATLHICNLIKSIKNYKSDKWLFEVYKKWYGEHTDLKYSVNYIYHKVDQIDVSEIFKNKKIAKVILDINL